MNVPDSHAAPVKPMILAVVNAVDAIASRFWVSVVMIVKKVYVRAGLKK